MADSSLETGYRWASITPDDHSGILYIVTFLAFTYSGLTFIARCFIKWRVLGLDDAAMLLAQIASIVQFSLLLVSLSAGLGKTFGLLSLDDYTTMASAQFGNQIALYISLGLSKIATILLTQRLFTRDMRTAWKICNVVTGCVVIWTVLAAFLVSVGCSPESMAPKTQSQTCPSIIARYQFLVVTDAITDIILVIIPAYLCWQLQMSVLIKLQVLAVFSFRLPLVALAGLFLKTWVRSLSTNNPGVDRSPAIIFHQCELCVSLMAGTIPCLKSFIRSFDTGSGVKAGFGSSNEYGSSGRTSSNALKQQSYQLSSLKRSKNSTSHTRSQLDENDGEIRVRSQPFSSGRAGQPPLAREKSNRSGYGWQQQETDRDSQGSRQELFIRKDLMWEVGSDARRGSDTPGMLSLPR
ncbi:Nn.00g030420.m01.CDS01 [Neocucurbitaria sp. VM-36]